MVCGSCGRRRVDPNGSFCDKCGSSVFVAEPQRPLFRSAVADARSAVSKASSSASTKDAVQSVQRSAKASSAAVRSVQRSAVTVQRDVARRVATARRAAPAIGFGRFIRFGVVVLVLWTAANWLLDIPEVIALKEGIQHGQFTDEQWRAAQDAVRARIAALLGSAPATTTPATPSAPKSGASKAPRAIERPSPTPSSVGGVMVRPTAANVRVPPGVSPVGTGVSMPRVVDLELPHYAPERLRGIVEGTILLQVVVRPHGEAGYVAVVNSPDPRLDADAISAVRRWRFAPGQRDGQPIPVLVEIEIPLSTR